jgi:hypothetical protein
MRVVAVRPVVRNGNGRAIKAKLRSRTAGVPGGWRRLRPPGVRRKRGRWKSGRLGKLRSSGDGITVTEEQGRRFEQQERVLGSKKQLRKKEEKRVSEVQEQFKKEVERNPRVGELLRHTQRFIAGWPRYADEHKGVPKAKLWLAYAANDPTGAAGFGATVDPADYLPRVVNGCLTPCHLCDQVQPLETRQSVWARTQRLWKQAERARDQEERAAVAKAAKAKAEAA